jgi:hypothetical protein
LFGLASVDAAFAETDLVFKSHRWSLTAGVRGFEVSAWKK